MTVKKAFPLSLMAISLTLTASIGLSVAWYANGAYLRISDVDVSLMSDPELGISLKNSSNFEDYYFGEFPYDELPKMKSGYSDEYIEGEITEKNGFVPVSAMFSNDWIGETDDEGELIEPQFCSNYKRATIFEENSYRKTKLAKSGFYSVPLYLICDHDIYASIDEVGTKFMANVSANEITAEELCKKDDKIQYDKTLDGLNLIVNSLRFSIYDCDTAKYWIVDPTKGDSVTYFAGTLDLDANKIYDFYYDESVDGYKEYFFGEYDDSQEIVYKTNVDSVEPSIYDAFQSRHGDGVEIVDMDYYIENNLVAVENSYTPKDLSNFDMIALTNHVPHKIILSIYIEGWDRDNTSISSYGAFFASIRFKLTRPNFSN